MKIVIKHWDNQQTPWMVGIKWPNGQIARFMGSWQDALDDALQLAKEIL